MDEVGGNKRSHVRCASVSLPNCLVRKLENYTRLSQDDRHALDEFVKPRQRHVGVRHDLIREGDTPRVMYTLVEGWACLYKTLSDGRRQNVAFLIPGDTSEINILLLKAMDHNVGAITALRVSEATRSHFHDLTDARA